MKFNLVEHFATQDPREGNRVVCKFGRLPYVREDHTVRREVFEDILLGLGVPEPPLTHSPWKLIIYVQCGGAREAIMRMPLHKVGRGTCCG